MACVRLWEREELPLTMRVVDERASEALRSQFGGSGPKVTAQPPCRDPQPSLQQLRHDTSTSSVRAEQQ
jgi:hypothetical protein